MDRETLAWLGSALLALAIIVCTVSLWNIRSNQLTLDMARAGYVWRQLPGTRDGNYVRADCTPITK